MSWVNLRTIVALLVLSSAAAVFLPSAAADQYDCVFTLHVGPTKQDVMCQPSQPNPENKQECVATLHVAFFKAGVECR